MRSPISALGAAALTCLLFGVGCHGVTDAPGSLPVNTDFAREWPEASPDAQGIDQAQLDIAISVASAGRT